MFIKNASGFSLIQVMVAAALLAGLSLAMMKQQQTAGKMQSKMHLNHEVNTTANYIQTLMANEKNCTATLKDVFPSGEVSKIKRVRRDPATFEYLPEEDVFSKEVSVGSGLFIEEMRLTKNVANQDVLRVKFKVGRMENGELVEREGVLGGGTVAKDFALNILTDSSGNFIKCFSVEAELLDSILDTLPSCVMSEEACSGAYAYSHGTIKIETILQERRKCIGIYSQKTCGFGSVNPKECFCYTPGCSCTTESVTCFNRDMQPCEEDNVTQNVVLNRCCQDPPPEAPTTGGTLGGYGGPGGSGEGCFVAGTQISLYNGGRKNIEDVEVGDELLDGNGRRVVAKKLVRYPYKGRIYSINGSGYFFTPNHPFKSLTGWKSLNPELSEKESLIEVSMLKVGDVLLKKGGDLELVLSLDHIYSEEPVYNFEVSDSHEYVAEDFVVHNLFEKEKERKLE